MCHLFVRASFFSLFWALPDFNFNMRKTIIAGNWKMNLNSTAAIELATAIRDGIPGSISPETEVLLCAPALYLESLVATVAGNHKISIAAQNAAAWKEGAYTGEISAFQLASSGIKTTLLGHSERRSLFGETDAVLKTKVDLAIEAGIRPVFCCGEPKEVREAETQEELVGSQIQNALFHLNAENFSKIVIAYEPVWAIGTGLTASSQQAQDMHAFIRNLIADKYGKEVADGISILYGGSMKASNASELLSMPDVDGGLIGGASLVAEEFLKIIECA